MNVMNYFQTNFEYFCGGLTQQQVAVLLGVTQTTVPRYVKNPKLIRMTAFLSLCRWANVSMDEFLFVDLRERAVPSFSMADVEGLKNNVDLFFEGNMVVMDKVSALNESDGAAIYGTVGSVEKLKVFFERKEDLPKDTNIYRLVVLFERVLLSYERQLKQAEDEIKSLGEINNFLVKKIK